MASYGDAERAWILTYYLTGDVVNPILYSLILVLLISWLSQHTLGASGTTEDCGLAGDGLHEDS